MACLCNKIVNLAASIYEYVYKHMFTTYIKKKYTQFQVAKYLSDLLI